jgi:hypothetical protein
MSIGSVAPTAAATRGSSHIRNRLNQMGQILDQWLMVGMPEPKAFPLTTIKNRRPKISRNARVTVDGGPALKFKRTGVYRLQVPSQLV